MPRKYTPEEALARFWDKVDKSGNCWTWMAAIDGKGYGRINAPGRKMVAAHRFSYELAFGPIPDGLFVCHRCDNRRCVNPDHLFLGTAKDNTADMIAKGRGKRPPLPNVKGERHPGVKLTAVQVMAIREAVATGVQQRILAMQYGVCKATISLIIKRKNWRHLP